MSNIISLLASLFISVIVSVLVYYNSNQPSLMESIWFGLISLFGTQIVITSVKVVQISKDITKIKAILTNNLHFRNLILSTSCYNPYKGKNGKGKAIL